MSVVNLTRYKFHRHPFATELCRCDVLESPNGVYVKFEEAMEASSNSVQQLKAEIAALEKEHFFTNENGTSCSGKYGVIAERLRQLSAV